MIGLGLLGGSVAGAARARGVAKRVVGVSRGRDTAAAAVAAGLADEGTADLAAGVAGADLVVLCTPVFAMADTLRRAAPQLAPGALVTDVGSVKGRLVETLPGLLPAGVTYVGAHPMAGSHQTGLRHASPDLFEGAACVLTPTGATPSAALARVRGFWTALGARIFERDPAQHDAEVAWVSHLPHAVAFAFAASLATAPRVRLRGSRAPASATSRGSRPAIPSCGPTSSRPTRRRCRGRSRTRRERSRGSRARSRPETPSRRAPLPGGGERSARFRERRCPIRGSSRKFRRPRGDTQGVIVPS